MREGKAKSSELIIYPDGTLYHIDLSKSSGFPPNVFLMGAAERVKLFLERLDEVKFSHQNSARPEFYAVWGMYRGVPMGAMSIGIGPDNMEIALNELHALFEYDHVADKWSEKPTKVNIIRVGTCGSFPAEVPSGSYVISNHAIGMDNLGNYYPYLCNKEITENIEKKFQKTMLGKVNPSLYAASAAPKVVYAISMAAKNLNLASRTFSGITITSPGFFAPEGRTIGRIKTAFSLQEFLNVVLNFEYGKEKILNAEMESSALFRIGGNILGYNTGAICAVLDNILLGDVLEKSDAEKSIKQCVHIAMDAMAFLVRSKL